MKRAAAFLVIFCLLSAAMAQTAPAATTPAAKAPAKAAKPVKDTAPYASLGALRIHYADKGQGQGAVVFLHGWSCDLTFWSAQYDALSAERRVLALDLPGCGKSTAPANGVTMDILADSVEAVLERAGVARAVLVVHSMGLAVAKRFMERHPSRAVGLFIVDGAYLNLPKDQPRVDGMRAKINEPASQTPEGWKKLVTDMITPTFGPATPQPAREKTLATMTGTPRPVAKSMLLCFLEPGGWSSSPVHVPARAVYAGGLGREGVPQYLTQVFPFLVYEEWTGVGHFIMFDQPERLSTAIADFVRRVLP